MLRLSPFWTLVLLSTLLTWSCSPKKQQQATDSEPESKKRATIGSVDRLSTDINDLISENAKIEILAEGFTWSEGPVWVPELESVLFTDVPENTIFKWNESEGLSTFLKPSGYTGYSPASKEAGANGLILDSEGALIMCQHGDRRVAKYTGDLTNPAPQYETIIDRFQDKRFNSPNDLILSKSGDLYFTDPPYGLADQDDDELKEISFNGVYKLSKDGILTVLDSTLTRPNGLAFSPDEQTLYVANSDPKNAIWMAYDVTTDGVTNARLFFDATSMIPEKKGLPDGMKVNKQGIIYATGPGGVLVFNPDRTHLGTILTELATANCAFGPDEKVLYMTTDDYLTRIALK